MLPKNTYICIDMATKAEHNKLIKNLIKAHNKWALIHRKNKTQFNYSFLRENFSSLSSTIEKNYESLAKAFEEAGINPDCHYGQYHYKNGKKTFESVLKELLAKNGVEGLNDNSMNKPHQIKLPSALKIGTKKSYPICNKARCKENTYKLGNIYAKGRRMYGDWATAVEAIGVNYEKDVLRKIAYREWTTYVEMYAKFIRSKDFNYNISDLKDNKKNYPIYSGLTKNYREKSPLADIQPDVMLGAYIETNAFLEGKYDELDSYYKKHSNRLKNEFFDKILIQNIWRQNKRVKGKPSGMVDRFQEELIQRYAAGKRITRYELERSGNREDKTLVSALRGRSRKNTLDFVGNLESAGFINSKLQALYAELDDPFTLQYLHEVFIRLFKESLENNENRLTREYCEENEYEFHNAIIRKYNSWEAGLRKFGIDPKVFSITASKRTKRAYIFQKFFEEMLQRYGFNRVNKVKSILSENDFTSNKSILGKDCNHSIRCKPDFVFEKIIIDPKTGYAAKRQNDQLERYTDHKANVYVITLRGKPRTEKRKNGKVHFLSFHDFIIKSEEIIGTRMNPEEEGLLTNALKSEPFWN